MNRSRIPLKRRLAVWRHRWVHRWKEFWAAKYTGAGAAEIAKIPDDELVFRVFDYIFQNWMIFDKSAQDYDTSQLSPSERALWYAWEVDCEVNNGGFNQYFFNHATRPTEPVVEAYALLGADSHKEVFLEAIRDYQYVVRSHDAAMKEARDDASTLLQNFSETYRDNPLKEVDSRYYSIVPKVEDILCDYIRAHADEFKRR